MNRTVIIHDYERKGEPMDIKLRPERFGKKTTPPSYYYKVNNGDCLKVYPENQYDCALSRKYLSI
ncbi:MAG: hypothetical protein LUC98_00660 [Lachnospiraceae bacterium]|nr:hypothetical protein [Lachnospiraceae bacterium]